MYVTKNINYSIKSIKVLPSAWPVLQRRHAASRVLAHPGQPLHRILRLQLRWGQQEGHLRQWVHLHRFRFGFLFEEPYCRWNGWSSMASTFCVHPLQARTTNARCSSVSVTARLRNVSAGRIGTPITSTCPATNVSETPSIDHCIWRIMCLQPSWQYK